MLPSVCESSSQSLLEAEDGTGRTSRAEEGADNFFIES